jgi:hypothetical protein
VRRLGRSQNVSHTAEYALLTMLSSAEVDQRRKAGYVSSGVRAQAWVGAVTTVRFRSWRVDRMVAAAALRLACSWSFWTVGRAGFLVM